MPLRNIWKLWLLSREELAQNNKRVPPPMVPLNKPESSTSSEDDNNKPMSPEEELRDELGARLKLRELETGTTPNGAPIPK